MIGFALSMVLAAILIAAAPYVGHLRNRVTKLEVACLEQNKALMQIAYMVTPNAASIGKRMAAIAEAAVYGEPY